MSVSLLASYQPDKPIFFHRNQLIPQWKFVEHVLTLADELPKSKYAINLCADRYHFTVTFCALAIRGIQSLLPPSQNVNVIENLSKKYAPCICLTDTEKFSDIENHYFVTLPIEMSENPSETGLDITVNTNKPIFTAFTSGSTGEPKANDKYWQMLAGTAIKLNQRFATSHTINPLVATVPSQHMYGLEVSVFMALTGGFTTHSTKPFYPVEIVDAIENFETPENTTLATTPYHLKTLLQSGLKLPKIKQIISATAPLSEDLAKSAETLLQAPVFEIFGCTECGSLATRRTLDGNKWQLLDDFSLEQDEQKWFVQAGHLSGKIEVNDHFEKLDARHFSLGGRQSDIFNVAGKRVSLSELTLLLQQIDQVNDAVVLAPKTNSESGRLRALVVSELPIKKITVELAKKIDPTLIPRPIIKVDRIPRNETGKVTRSELDKILDNIEL